MTEVVAALIAAGIPAQQAARLADVLQKTYGKDEGKFKTLGVTGAASVVGAVQVNDTIDITGVAFVGKLDCDGGAIVRNELAAESVRAVAGGVGCIKANAVGAQIDAPLAVNKGANVRGGAAFADNTIFNGGIQIKGPVDWQGRKVPAKVAVVTGIFGNPLDEPQLRGKLMTTRQEVMVLNDNGALPWGRFGATLGATSAAVTASGGVTITPNFTTATVYSINGVSFNENDCSVSVTSTAVTVVTGWDPAVTVAITMHPTDPMPLLVGRTDGGPGAPDDVMVNLYIQ